MSHVNEDSRLSRMS